MDALPRDKLVELLYLLMRDSAPTGEIVRVIRTVKDTTCKVTYTSPELEAYATRLADELLA